jgi:hypothetical protein
MVPGVFRWKSLLNCKFLIVRLRKATLEAFLVLAVLLRACFLWGQISPGELSRSHAALEGMFNCTKCHDIGAKISDNKCLSCHQDIQNLINWNRGFHASQDARGKQCANCHSDHHGRNFDMVRFDEKGFNHLTAGFELTGKHKTIDCRECHKADLIQDQNIKKRPETYLGLGKDCKDCHQDVHQGTLSVNCAQCHTTDNFAPASRFRHEQTHYPLAGKHKNVGCIECHPKETRNNAEFQRFSGVAFTNCNSCHQDVHKNKLGNNCKECHTEQGFEVLNNKFNHNKTGFALAGKHKTVSCKDCHNLDVPVTDVFQDRLGVKNTDCVICHKDVHEGKFGKECKSCHNEESFKIAGVPENFNHANTDFPLLGMHAAVNCKDCHVSDFIKPLEFGNCYACHKDYHETVFTQTNKNRDCAECHDVNGFDNPFFGVTEHEKTNFPLTGAHIATPCFACHLDEAKKPEWQFRNIGERCVDCHEDIHKNTLQAKYYPEQNCNKCHVTESWAASGFDHSTTAFKLEGAHNRVSCGACHKPDAAAQTSVVFAPIGTQCVTCHENVHGRQFEKNGTTNCRSCHGVEKWEEVKYDHNRAAFKLDGKHAQVACAECHKKILMDGQYMVQYKFESFDCIVCHK